MLKIGFLIRVFVRMREETTVVCVDVKDEIFSCDKKLGSEEMVIGKDYGDVKDDKVLLLSPLGVGRSRFEVSNRRVMPSVKMDFIVEKALPNGDLYAGGFSSNVPHGQGKYLWSDGCMYEGDWKKGKASGKGKFSWPSGATYVGEFRSGRMEGFGTFIGSDGDTYRGNWIGDRKQGYGKKWYANGDYYKGMWKKNMQDGQGRYVWSSNGNEYNGEWKNGVMSGRGMLTWANGDRYEGLWENGVMKGSCAFIRADKVRSDGDLCVESGKEVRLKEICLVGMAKRSGVGLVGGGGNLRKCSSVDGSRGSMTEKPFPRICIWESDGEDGDITCDIIDNVEASMFYHDGTGIIDMDGIKQFPSSIYRTPSEVKKPGKTVSKGHRNYELMLNLQLGIRYCVTSLHR